MADIRGGYAEQPTRPEAEAVGDPEVGAMLAQAFMRQGLPMIDVPEAPLS